MKNYKQNNFRGYCFAISLILVILFVSSCSNSSKPATTTNETTSTTTGVNDTTTNITNVTTTTTTTPIYGYKLGMNLEYLSPWSTQIVFVDVLKQSKHWDAYQLGSTVWITDIDDINLPLGDNGYPTVDIPFDHDNDASTNGFVIYTVIFNAIGQNYPSGDYTLKFEGDGEISMRWDAGINPEKGYSSTPRHYYSSGAEVSYPVPVVPNIGISLQIEKSNTNNPIKNIQLILPGYENSQTTNTYHPFYPPFIEKLEDFEVIRIMNLLHINEIVCDNPAIQSGSKDCLITWNNRIKEYYTYTVRGRAMPWEYIIDLINQVEGADIWINIPHAADNDYVTKLAELLLTRLNSEKKIYIEWSNEVWNPGEGFPQHQWYEENGIVAFPNDSVEVAAAKFYVKGLLNIFSIFENVFTGQKSRLVRVLNSQQGNTYKTTNLLSYLEDTTINPNLIGNIDAVAIGAYFGWSLLEKTDGVYISPSVDSLLTSARNDLPSVATSTKEAKQAIDNFKSKNNITYNISLFVYEGGSHITPMSTDWAYLGFGLNTDNIDWTNYTNANKDPQMYDIYIDWGKTVFQNGGDLLMAFSFVSKYPEKTTDKSGNEIQIGTSVFGHLQTLDQPLSEAPKYKALIDLMQ